jgi:DNA segregation ATPase FtsK/SpoIIIE-like protein
MKTVYVHLLVCYLNKLQNARCNSKDSAQQTNLSNNCKNTKLKLLKTNATIWFNKIYEVKQLKPNYINVKINGQRPQDKRTTINAIRFRINQEIKFLYCKKHDLDQRLYYLHPKGAGQYNGMWQHTQEYIDAQISKFMDNLYKKNFLSALV